MGKQVKLLGIQLNSTPNDKIKNYQKVSKFLKESEGFGADLVLLPEMFNAGYDFKSFEKNAESIPTDTTTMFLSGMAETYKTNIAGTYVEKMLDGTLRNTLAVFDRTGALAAKYHKIHLFSHQGSEEGKYITAGDEVKCVDLDFGRVGLSTCYDLRFPELYRKLTLEGAKIILTPAAWPMPRVDHWVTLNKARAIENQVFMFSVNQTGKTTLKREDAGHSVIVTPWGEIVANAGVKEGTMSWVIDLDEIQESASKIPVLQDRRMEIYDL